MNRKSYESQSEGLNLAQNALTTQTQLETLQNQLNNAGRMGTNRVNNNGEEEERMIQEGLQTEERKSEEFPNDRVNALINEDNSILSGVQDIMSGQYSRNKRNYNFVSNEKREQLIAFLSTGKSTIKEAAQKFGINYSTAKYIFKKHRCQILEEEEKKYPRYSRQILDQIPPDMNRLQAFKHKIELLAQLSARMLHHAQLPKEEVISLIMEERSLLDLLLLEANNFNASVSGKLIESIITMHRSLDWYLVALSATMPQNAQSVEEAESEHSIEQHLKALQVLLSGLVLKSFKKENPSISFP